jgi:predicted kinase
MPTLYILGGLPGTGKSTIARALSQRIGAVWLRIDSVEQELINRGTPRDEVGGRGYEIAYAIAQDNLRNGLHVIADSVNPIEITRHAWREVARAANVPFIEVEIVCENLAEHRRRVTERASDIAGLIQPTWAEVENREYETWHEARLRIDTALLSPSEAVEQILKHA